MQISIQPEAKEASEAAADFIATRLRTIVLERGSASLALSGGSTPKLLYIALSALDVPWHSTHVFQVDERVVAESNNARNALHIVERLISRVDIPIANWHPMPVDISPLSEAAEQYADVLMGSCQGPLDVVHLGLGDDGHTASWPPGDPVLHSAQQVDSVRDFHGYDRLTLTPRAINAAKVVTWLVVGSDKSRTLRRWQEGDPRLPASTVRRDRDDALFTDEQTEFSPA